MRNYLLGLLAVFMVTSLSAQNLDDYMEVQREALKTEKKAVVAEAMDFSEAESELFWPLYNEYNNKMYTHNTRIYQLIKRFADNYEKMSDEKAIELWNEAMKIELDLASLEKQYFKKFQKILPGKRTVRYFQVENKIKTLVDAQLSLDIPLVDN